MPMLSLEKILETALLERASDIHLTVGVPPILRINGKLLHLGQETLTPADTEFYVRKILNERLWGEFERTGECDSSYAFGDTANFRVNVFRQKGNYGAVMRLIPSEIPTIDGLQLPPILRTLCAKRSGLILVTGPTGSGKTTTLAAMIEYMLRTRNEHIITIEDPIEFYHNSQNSLVTQREVGDDVPSFAEAIRRALRQDPDVILVGEMRDLETIAAAITAAETGHLVFGTLHTTGAAETIDRIVDAFPMNQQAQIRTQLAAGLQAVISQILLPKLGPDGQVHGRVAAFEIMTTTDAIRSRIRDNKTNMIKSDLQTGAKFGMQTLDSHLTQLFKEGLIAYEELITKSQDPDSVVAKLKEEGYGA